MRNNYDLIAPWYDKLSRLVFGQAQVRAQTVLLPFIPPGGQVLIVGGGTGWILEELSKMPSSNLHITYVEASLTMLRLSEGRNLGANEVRFIHKPVEEYQPTEIFDAVFTAFFFDNFSNESINTIFPLLHSCLRPNGKWLFADFQNQASKSRWWKKALLKLMYIFFRILCRIEATNLVDMEPRFAAMEYTTAFRSGTYKNFILSVVYQKSISQHLPGNQ